LMPLTERLLIHPESVDPLGFAPFQPPFDGTLHDAVDLVPTKTQLLSYGLLVENKALRATGDDRLVGTRYDWLRNPVTMDTKQRRRFVALRDSGLKTARAWALKETAMSLYDYVYEGPAANISSGGTVGPCAAAWPP